MPGILHSLSNSILCPGKPPSTGRTPRLLAESCQQEGPARNCRVEREGGWGISLPSPSLLCLVPAPVGDPSSCFNSLACGNTFPSSCTFRWDPIASPAPVDSLDGARTSVNSHFLKLPSVTLFPAWATGYSMQTAPHRAWHAAGAQKGHAKDKADTSRFSCVLDDASIRGKRLKI